MDVSRAQVLAYRYAAQGLGPDGRGAGAVLATGIQDYPPGRSASLALRLRAGSAPGTPTVLVHSIRGAVHLHPAADLARLAAALRIEDGRDLPLPTVGPFGAELGTGFGAALDEVAAAMRTVVAEGHPLTKGELSGAVSPRVDARLTPWCAGCAAHHVHDLLFRMATLQAGLAIEVDAARLRYRPVEPVAPMDALAARAELLRAFLAAFGPARPARAAGWLGLTPAATVRWWDGVAAELRPVEIDGERSWSHTDDLELLRSAPEPRGVRLPPPYDPLTELADRSFLVPDAALRRKVWRSAANPGVVLVDGEIAGVWRGRRRGEHLTLTIEAFTPLTAARRRAAEADAVTLAGGGAVDLEFG